MAKKFAVSAMVSALLRASLILSIIFVSVNSRGELKTLTEETWGDMLVGEWMVEFFAPWCPACRQLEPIWQSFADWSDDLGIKVASIDVSANPGLSGRFAITALPTIFHVKDGVFRQYEGPKRKDDFISFIEEAKWKDIDPLPSWKSPQSFQMTSLASFFKLSMLIRNVHNDLVEFGIPHWMSYSIFGLGTIILGTVLGLLIVCIIDHTCPVKKSGYESSPKVESHETSSISTPDEKKNEESDKPDDENDSGEEEQTSEESEKEDETSKKDEESDKEVTDEENETSDKENDTPEKEQVSEKDDAGSEKKVVSEKEGENVKVTKPEEEICEDDSGYEVYMRKRKKT